jgi:hypothetical protein
MSGGALSRLIRAPARICEIVPAFAPGRRLPRGVDAAFPDAVGAWRLRHCVNRAGSAWRNRHG